MSNPRVGVLLSRVRVEEKMLLDAFQRSEVPVEIFDDRQVIFEPGSAAPPLPVDVVLERCINHSRAVNALRLLGDAGIHAKVGQAFWDELAGVLSKHFHEGDFNGGLVAAISRAGERLAEHFPHAGEADVNELPDHVDFGPDPR